MSSLLENIQVGDWVKISFTFGQPAIAQVTRVTAKQFVASDYRFWKKDGSSLDSSGWGARNFAKPISEAEVLEEKQRIQKNKMIESIIKDLKSKPEIFSFELIEDWVEVCFKLNKKSGKL